MSRIGRMPVVLPAGVKLHVNDGLVRAEGPKGKLQRRVEPEIAIKIEGNEVVLTRREETRRAKSLHGLTRVLVANMVEGVGKGFTRVLEINGVGYRAEVERMVVVTLEGADRELLGQVAAAIRELRPPEPYKAKGIKYAEERIRRKAGKAASATAR